VLRSIPGNIWVQRERFMMNVVRNKKCGGYQQKKEVYGEKNSNGSDINVRDQFGRDLGSSSNLR
jgi:hypothetical protein